MALWGSFAFKPYNYLSLFGFSGASLGPGAMNGEWQRRPRALSSTLCLALPFIAVLLRGGGSGGARVCAEVPRLLSCGDAIIWRDQRRQKPAAANGDGRKASSNHPRVVLQTLMVHDAAAPWDASAGKWPPFPLKEGWKSSLNAMCHTFPANHFSSYEAWRSGTVY